MSSTREYRVRIRTARRLLLESGKTICLRIFDDSDQSSSDLLLEKSLGQPSNNVEQFLVRTKEKLGDVVRRLKLHTRDKDERPRSSNERVFLQWIELTDVQNKRTFCFPVNDYLPSSLGDALELTEVYQEKSCDENNERSNQKRIYDIRTKTGHQGFLGIKSSINAQVFLKLFDTDQQSTDALSLLNSRFHERSFRSNQTDQFEVETKINLGPLKKVELWHDGKKGTRLHCESLEITDRNNGQVYCFPIKDHLESGGKLILTDYQNERCSDSRPRYLNAEKEEDSTTLSSQSQAKTQTIPVRVSSSDLDVNQTLFKVRTRVGHKGLLSLGAGGTDANVYLRLREGENTSNDILLKNSLTHNHPFSAGHTDVFEIGVPTTIQSPDQLDVFHDGKKNDGLYLKWIEIMNMKTLERKCFPVNRWLDLNDGDKKTHVTLTGFTTDESCEESEYREHHNHDLYKTEYIVRTKTSRSQASNDNNEHANVYLKIFNDKKKHTEDMLLSNSKHRSNPFRPGKIDRFEIGSIEQMDDSIDKIELWHDNKSNFHWHCQWIEIKNKKTGSIKCFGVNRLLSRKSSDGVTKIVLTLHSHYPCDQIEHEIEDLSKSVASDARQHHSVANPQDFAKRYIVTVKTGKKILSGTKASVFVRLSDDQNRQSEEILLEQSVTNKTPFGRDETDEFHLGIRTELSNLRKVHLWHTGDENQGWNVQWLQIEDVDAHRLYCFPVNKWLDSNSNEGKTQAILTEFTVNEPCSTTIDRKEKVNASKERSSENDEGSQRTFNPSQFKRTYHIETKTGRKGFLGLSPTGTNAKAHVQIHDRAGRVSEPMELHRSVSHRNSFERGQTDEFDVGSTRSLDEIEKLEVWHDGSGLGHGWLLDYIAVTDNRTGEESCFFVGEFLNEENGGVEEKHLILNKQTVDNRPCREHQFDGNELTITETEATTHPQSVYQQTYRVETKTGHRGLFGLSGAGSRAPVFIRIHDQNDQVSEPLQLRHSLNHKNQFERNQSDRFDVGTRKNLDGVKKLELWHEGEKSDGWQVDHVQVIDNRTGDSYCFFVNGLLDSNTGLKTTRVLLEYPSINVPCTEEEWKKTTSKGLNNPETNTSKKRNFTIRTKTGDQVEAGSTAPIHIQLFDDENHSSEEIRLKLKDHEKHQFEPGAMDEFQVTSSQPLSDRLTGIRVKHRAEKYQGWYVEWIEVTDEDHERKYCFPIQRWLDKGEDDQQTNVYFDRVSELPCRGLSNTMPQSTRRSRAAPLVAPSGTVSSSASSAVPLQNTYHVTTKTGKKGLFGLSPTGTNADVFIRIIDKNGKVSADLPLRGSTDHRNQFERGRTDEFDVGTSEPLNGITAIDLWTNDKGLGSGWFPEYLQLIENKTGALACFPVNQYLNEKNGGTEANPLRLSRASNNQPCDQTNDEDTQTGSSEINVSSPMNDYKSTFSVIATTGAASTDASVFIRLYDRKDRQSEAIPLKNSTRHKKNFQKNQTDQFDIGTDELLEDISRVELWHDGEKNNAWQVECLQIIANQSNRSYCFPVPTKTSGLKQTPLMLDKPLLDASCSDYQVGKQKKAKEKNQRNFTIRTKTGNHLEAGSTTPIHIQLVDDQDRTSEDIRLKHDEHEKHNFQPGAIDEFQVTSEEPLSNRLAGIRVKHNADKYQGWYAEWIEITDEDHGRKYCYPIRRWLDKAENDKKTDVYFTEVSAIPCDRLSQSMPTSRRAREKESNPSRVSSTIPPTPIENTYHVLTKTGKKGFLGLAPTGTNADVFIQIIDRQGKKSEAIPLKGSTDHRNKFERGKIDEFDVGSVKRLNGVEQLEIWSDGSGFGHGWYADYVVITDNRTGEEACFLIHEYLNKENGGVNDHHLVLKKQSGNVSCRERSVDDDDDAMDSVQTRRMKALRTAKQSSDGSSAALLDKRTYHIETKTGRKGFLGLSPTGTNADVFLRIHDQSGHVSEPISLRRSTKHSNPFEKGQLDSFDVGTAESLESIKHLELYHDGSGLGHGWNVEYVNVLDNTSGHSYCFPAQQWLSTSEHLILDEYVRDQPCAELSKEQLAAEKKKDRRQRRFTVRTKTGSHVEAGSTAAMYLRLFDDHSQKSERIRLKANDKESHRFEPGAIDQFQIAPDKPLSHLAGIELSHSADKFQGWYGEWISLTDNDTGETFCFPIQRWLDKGESDGKTDLYLKPVQMPNSCEQLPDTMKPRTRLLPASGQRTSPAARKDQFKSTYHVQTKTAKKGLFGLAPTGTDADVFVRLHDRNENVSEPIELKDSLDHKNKFNRGQIDEFDVGSLQELQSLAKLEVWTDKKGLASGWCPEYIRLTDQKTGETSCFPIEQYLNEKNGGVNHDHLIVEREKDPRLCGDLETSDLSNTHPSRTKSLALNEQPRRFEVEIKTERNEPDAPAFIRLQDTNRRKSAALPLKSPTKHRNQPDRFSVQTDEPLDDVAQVDLWGDGDEKEPWQVDSLNILDKKKNTSYCFPTNSIREANSEIRRRHLHFDRPSINDPCRSQTNRTSYTSVTKKHKADRSARNYTVRTKTGSHVSAGSTTPIHLQLIDVNNDKSREIRLKKKDMEGHHFAPNSIDEFKITLSESLSTLKAVKLSLDADRKQGWYGEWISITDDDNQETYCFPIQRWLDKGEADHKTHVVLDRTSLTPCEKLPDSMLIPPLRSEDKNLSSRRRDEPTNVDEFQIRTRTADKSLRGKLGRDANVYLNIYNPSQKQIAGPIPLANSTHHRIPFQRHHTDRFLVRLPNVKMPDIERVDLYHDGHNDGWFCDFVEIHHLSSKAIKCFSVHRWLDEMSDRVQFSMTNYQNVPCDEPGHNEHLFSGQYYTVRVKTNTTNLSANNSIEASIKLFGRSHQTERIPLHRTIDNEQPFVRPHSLETFEIRSPNKLNSIQKVEFSYRFLSDRGKLALESMEIVNLSTGDTSCFPINRILTSSDTKAQLLTLDESSGKPCST